MNPPVAFLDSSVLYPAGTRNLLLRLAVHHLFQARWSADVHREWMAAVRRNYPDIPADRLERTRILMDLHAEGCLVVDYEALVGGLRLPDPKDEHVLAAAITAGASRIVTANLRDFPTDRLRPHRMAAVHPDEFVLAFLRKLRHRTLTAMREHRASLRNPPLPPEAYVSALDRQGLVRTAAALRPFSAYL